MLKQTPNRLFIKLLLSFWLCSSVIIAAVALLPLMQQNYDRQAIPAPLQQLLAEAANQLQSYPNTDQHHPMRVLHRWVAKHPRFQDKHLKFYLADSQDNLLYSHSNPKLLRHFQLMVDEVGHPISHQFRNDLMFGPYQFNMNGQNYSLYGRFPEHHPRPWFLYLAEHKGLTLALAILLSGLLCALLAWHLGKPLRLLKQSAEAIARGNLTTRVDAQVAQRRDEIGQLAQAFNLMGDSIESMVLAQQRLIGDISHELRTPLTRLQLALALARKHGLDGKELTRIADEADQLECLIAELLELSRVKANLPESRKRLELNETLDQVLGDAEFEAEQQGKVLHIHLPELAFSHYPRPLSRAIENLLRNAIRYATLNIWISAQQRGNQLLITIHDDGPGVETEALAHLFKPFFRPDSARQRDSGGWGLGMAIAAAAIQAHDGEIQAFNHQPHGLRLDIVLPLNQPQ
ncbi:ATP-binding protein [Shewanella sp. NIFS-20-20]|uniref:ATP-binding protein n=1 Tax=Shewanella sp. NIFS-20-20 TaxID=2853806 RepID=UPI001C4791E9|nr:ATP-binding protein [Shewanella sp. NIFS-20-20]MBV7317523.1 HAMP domain-containing protein [Shewanella sp. NIFS-20-20]